MQVPHPDAGGASREVGQQIDRNFAEIEAWAARITLGSFVETFSVRGTAIVAALTNEPAYAFDGVAGGADEFYTPSITDIPSTGTFTSLTLDAGVWELALVGDLDADGAPTTGYVSVGFTLGTSGSLEGVEAITPWQAFNVHADNVATVSHSKLVYSPDPFTAQVFFDNQLDVACQGAALCWTGKRLFSV